MSQSRGLLTPEERARITELQDLLIHRFVEHREATAEGHRQVSSAPACGSAPGWVVGWDDDIYSRPLCRLSVPLRDYLSRVLSWRGLAREHLIGNPGIVRTKRPATRHRD